jgi:hypothetical protein
LQSAVSSAAEDETLYGGSACQVDEVLEEIAADIQAAWKTTELGA